MISFSLIHHKFTRTLNNQTSLEYIIHTSIFVTQTQSILPMIYPFMHHLPTTMIYFISFFFTRKMAFLSPLYHRNSSVISSNSAAEGGRGRAFLDPDAKSKILGGISDVSAILASAAWPASNEKRLTKLLLNVNLQSSLRPVQVVMSPENNVSDLIKAVVEIYMREKRRPLLASGDPRCFELHYSQFNLEGLKPQEKLNNLGSRNFFLCQTSSNIGVTSSCLNRAKAEYSFPLTNLMDLML